MRRDRDDMYRFIQMAVCSMLVNSNNIVSGAPSSRLVNRAVELWEEIEKQLPDETPPSKDD